MKQVSVLEISEVHPARCFSTHLRGGRLEGVDLPCYLPDVLKACNMKQGVGGELLVMSLLKAGLTCESHKKGRGVTMEARYAKTLLSDGAVRNRNIKTSSDEGCLFYQIDTLNYQSHDRCF